MPTMNTTTTYINRIIRSIQASPATLRPANATGLVYNAVATEPHPERYATALHIILNHHFQSINYNGVFDWKSAIAILSPAQLCNELTTLTFHEHNRQQQRRMANR